jgi:polyphosphate kinase
MSPRTTPNPFINREVSWLEFNSRVLEEAQDPKTPLFERVKFFGIFYSNLDEFFMVRVASILRRISEGDLKPDPAGLSPFQELELVNAKVRALETSAQTLYHQELLPALAKEKVRILDAAQVGPAHQQHLDRIFENEIYPVLTPIAVDPDQPFPRLVALAQHLAVLLEPANSPEPQDKRLALVQVPGRMPGLLRLPETGGVELCWLSDVVRSRVSALFAGYRIAEVAAFRLTRDSELELDDEGDRDYVRMLELELKKRAKARPIRVEHEESMSPEMLARIERGLGVPKSALSPVRRPMDTRALMTVVDLPGFEKLRYAPQPPLMPAVFEQQRSIFDIIAEKDVLLNSPYDSFDPVVEFLEAAAEDPDVLAIKQTLYRTSGNESPLMKALKRAAENGKQVTVLLELTARFDEDRNIGWARDLEDAGAHVLYGVAGLKVHAKVALVVRREAAGIRRYVHLGTGNYNERTARLYTDMGLLTAADDFGRDASGVFNTMTGYSEPPTFRQLVMAPVGLRDRILSLIRREADRARSGQVSGILAKMNSLVDPKIIQELCEASNAGVQIKLNVRGICCVRPGVPNLSENIRVVSIVDRYLEHSRAFVFRNGGNAEVYLSSADWMPRNLDRRIELMFPIVEESARQKVIDVLEAQFADNRKARVLRPDGSYERVTAGRSEALRVQEYLYRKTVEERERLRSVTPVRFTPIEAKQ